MSIRNVDIAGPVFTGISDQIAIHGRFRANEIAFVQGERRVTWQAYNEAANRIAHMLIASGVRPGERVALLVANGLWAHEVLLGIWRAGAAAVPLSPMLTAATLANMLADSGAQRLFASPEYLELAAAAAKDETLITPGVDFDREVMACSSAFPGHSPAARELAVIIYSSGTTGTPKGIAHDHESRLKFGAYFAAEFRFHYRSVALSCIPMHSNGAWLSWLPAKWIGATTVILPAFTADGYLDIVRRHAPTHGFAVPTMAAALLQHPDIETVRLDCFETLITAGSPMPDAVKREMCRLSGDALYELWGLTEGVATIISPADMARRPQSVGRPMLGCDIRLIDGEDQDVTFRQAGEIVGYSAGMMSGYWNRPDANRDVVWRDATGRAYLRTGDIGEFDADGYLVLRGRKKDMIISGGINVYPIDIEAVLLTHEAVEEVVVFGVDDERWGETPVAIVRLREAATANAEALRAWANERLARHQRLSALAFRAAGFPRNTLGKVRKNELRSGYLAEARPGH
ncbi:MAG: AMP-binding protein [Gammaproteobacteria bacterium]|nr:AMP-binding protein [Gammaproteobacteria bacterium]